MYAVKSGFWLLFCGRIFWVLPGRVFGRRSTIILDVTNNENRGKWMGSTTWFYMGGVLGAVISGLGADLLGYTSMLWLAAGLGATGWLVNLIFLPETRRKSIGDENAKNQAGNNNYLSNSTIWVAALIQGMNRFAIAGVLAPTIALLVKNQIMTPELVIGVSSLTGLISGLRMMVSMAASPLIGIISDRTRNRWRSTLIMLLLSALSMYLISGEHLVLILIGLVLSSIASGSLQTLSTAMVGDVVLPTQRGKAISLLHTSGDLASALGPVATYAIMPGIGLSGVFISCALLFLAVIPITIWERNKTKILV
jgi:MFS family permease